MVDLNNQLYFPIENQLEANSETESLQTTLVVDDASNRKDMKFIITLSVGFLGLQGVFSVFFASGNSYLISLGFSNTAISICWLAGPVAGFVFQPVVGALSDSSAYAMGKRRPFIICGTSILLLAMIAIAWANEIIFLFSGMFRPGKRNDQDGNVIQHWGLLIFVNIWIWIASFAIQPVQMGLRSLIIDLVPSEQQTEANIWATRFNLLGSVIGFSINSIDLAKYFNFLGWSQFQILCSLVSINLTVCIAITCYWAQERKQERKDLPVKLISARRGIVSTFKSNTRLSTVVRIVCLAQIFSWFAWFPFLYYTSQYVSGLYEDSRIFTSRDPILIHTESNRFGSFAMLLFALSSLTTSIIHPLMIQRSASQRITGTSNEWDGSRSDIRRVRSLRRIWISCQIIFFGCMTSTFLVNGVASAYIMVVLAGVSNGGAAWIPFTLISEDTRRPMDDEFRVVGGGDSDNFAATVVGIHNMAISAPQIIAALCSTVFFSIARYVGSNQDNLEVWLLRAGGLSTLVAAFVVKSLPGKSLSSI